ncbi:MAG: single-stranded DNA-binding protein [Polyangiaceae bacterium]|nr:single-stranded DNA-binding protein [Polyangiaceae bacterium]
MAEGLNRVMLLGNLGADPELRHTQGGQSVLNLRLATTETYVDQTNTRKERTDWHNVVVWGKRGEALAKILAKGSSLFVEGSLRTSSFEGRDGQKRWKTEVIAKNILLTGGGGAGRSRGAAPDYERGAPPERPAAPANDRAAFDEGGHEPPPGNFNEGYSGDDDDIPF